MYKLDIETEEVYRYLGYKGNTPEDTTLKVIDEVTAILREKSTPKVEYKIFDITKTDDGYLLDGTTLTLVGKNISQMLSESKRCILMAVTLGQEVENISRLMQVKDLSKCVIFDACASSMVEDLCNQLEATIKIDIDKEGKFFTDRFSPGYGDLPITIQSTICNILNTSKTMGLNVTSSGIMIPRKSITAIIGIADTPQAMRIKGCAYCSLVRECEYRKLGRTCTE